MNLLLTLQSVLLFYILAVVVHILMCRFGDRRHFMAKGMLLGIAAALGLLIKQINGQQLDIIGLYLFFAAWLLYIMIFINLLNSVTLKMLGCLHAHPQGCLPIETFSSVFNTDDGLFTRLEMMRANGLIIVHDNNTLQLTRKARVLLKIIATTGRVLSLSIH